MIKEYLLSRKLRKTDLILFALCVILGFLLLRLSVPLEETRTNTTELSLGYIAREKDDRYYAVDEGHSRLICFDKDGKVQFEIIDPEGDTGFPLYIDDFCLDDEHLYISASSWNGMLLDGEYILAFDKDGQYLETVAANDYASRSYTTNKHRFYGLKSENGVLRYGECYDDNIIIHALDENGDNLSSIFYPNAFNSVSDLIFENDYPIIMNKKGLIVSYENRAKPKLLYTVQWEKELNRIPFRMDASADGVIFTDIRNGQAVKADHDNQTGIVLSSDTDSQTAVYSEDGSSILLIGSAGLSVNGTENKTYFELEKNHRDLLIQNIFIASVILLSIAVILLIFRLTMTFSSIKQTDSGRFITIIVILVSVVCAIISSILLNTFRTSYREKIQEQLESTALVVASGINEEDLNNINEASDFDTLPYRNICSLMERSFPLSVDFYRTTYCNILKLNDDHLSGYGLAYLDQSIGVYFPLDEVETDEVIRVYESKAPVWNDEVFDVSGTYLSVKVPIMGSDNQVIGAVAVGADTFVVDEMISSMQQRVLFSIIIILLLIWIVSTEAIALYSSYQTYQNKIRENAQVMPAHLLRLLIFAVFTAFNLVSSFLPVYILRRCDIFPEGSREMIASLPMTVNIFVMGIMSLLCANMVRRFGIKKIIMSAAIFSMCGNLLMLIIPSYVTVMIGLALDGIGVGLISNAIYVALTYISNEEDRQNCFTIYTAASLSGINFGMILGGLLASNIGQRYVFLVVALIWAVLVLLGSYLAKSFDNIAHDNSEIIDENERIGARRFIRNKVIYSFFALIQNPYIVFNSFIFYFVPIYCEGIGYNETIVSVLLMLYSEIAVLFGDKLTEKTNKTLGDYAIYLAIVLNVIAVAYFAISKNTAGLLFALITLGISASFGKPSHQTYFLRQSVTKEYGEDKAMGIYNFSENIGESLGPVIFARLLGAGTALYGFFLGVISGMAALHYIINRKDLKSNEGE